jgi:hypothetical protein
MPILPPLRRLGPLLLMILLPSAALAQPAAEEEPFHWCETFTFQLENDVIANTDRNYTNGFRLACATSPSDGARRLISSLPGVDRPGRNRFTYALGQSMFTPEDIEEAEPILDDQPYAGWLYLGLGLESEVRVPDFNTRWLDKLELQLGVVGPESGAEDVQRFVHDAIGSDDPRGWDNQLDTEPGVNLFYNRIWGSYLTVPFSYVGLPDVFLDASPQVGLALGNIYTFASTGLTFRIGTDLPDDYGPPAIRPAITGSDSFEPEDGFGFYAFAGAHGRAVARNIFLDGNTFEDSQSVDKEWLIGEIQAGGALTYNSWRLSYTQVFRTKEFDGQERQTFGAFTLSVRF